MLLAKYAFWRLKISSYICAWCAACVRSNGVAICVVSFMHKRYWLGCCTAFVLPNCIEDSVRSGWLLARPAHAVISVPEISLLQTPPTHPFHHWSLEPTGFFRINPPLGIPHFSL